MGQYTHVDWSGNGHFDPPIERAAFLKGYAEKSYKNLIQGGSGAFGIAATRIEAFVAKGGTFAYGNYPDIDALFLQQP